MNIVIGAMVLRVVVTKLVLPLSVYFGIFLWRLEFVNAYSTDHNTMTMINISGSTILSVDQQRFVSTMSTQYDVTLHDDVTQTPKDKITGLNLVNITIGIFAERSAQRDFPFNINRTIGLIKMAQNQTRKILQYAAKLVSYSTR